MRKLRCSLVACMLVFTMMFMTCATSFAALEEVFTENTINYVSFGASNVNGYGLTGYLPEGITAAEKDTANVFGYDRCPEGSYVDLIRDNLEAEGYTVNVFQRAISSMRVEELRILLDEDYYGDAYSDWRFIGPGKWFENAAVTGGLDELREDCKVAIENANLITVDIGVNNFGVYLSNQIQSGGTAYDADLALVDPELAEKYNSAKAYVYQLIDKHAGEYSAAVADLDFTVDAMAYALAGFCYNYDIVMKKIYELNPNATVVAVSIQNLMEGLEGTLPGVDGTVPFGDLFGALVDAANLYVAVGSPYSDNYLFADVSENGRVEFFLDQLLAWDGTLAGLDQDMRDCFIVYDDDLRLVEQVEEFAQGSIENRKTELICVGVEVLSEIMQLGANNNVLDLASLFTADFTPIENNLKTAIQNELLTAATIYLSTPGYEYSVDEDFFANIASASDVPESLVNTVATIAIRTGIGNSFYGHPNRNGHVEIKDAIIDAIENGTKGKDVIADEIDILIREFNELIEEYGPNAVERIYAYLENEGYIEQLKTAINELLADLENPDSDLSQKLVAETDKLLAILETETGEELPSGEDVIAAIRNYEETLGDIEEYIANNEEIQETIAKIEDIISQINDIIANPEAYIQNVIGDVVAKFEENLEAATSADYAICGDNHYVAFAGTNTAGEEDYEYSYQVATYIDDEATSYHNFTDGTPIKDLAAYITSLEGESLEALKDATIITYQTDAKNIVLPLVEGDNVTADDWAALLDVDAEKAAEIKTTIISALKGEYADKGTAALNDGKNTALEIKEKVMTKLPSDWATALDTEGAKADEVIETILETAYDIVSYNLDATLVDMVAPLAEELVFNTVAYLVNNIKAVEAIKETNPDALIAVVGLHNPVKGLMVSVDGQDVDLGEYVDYFIDATNVYNTIYAAASDNVIFVEADETEIAGYEGTINIDTTNPSSLMQAIMTLDNKLIAGTVVTENGHNYILNQLKTAITKVNHLDADDNDICDKCGANLAPVNPTPTPNPNPNPGPGPGGSGGNVVRITITFNTNGGSKIDSAKVAEGKTLAAPKAPVKEGYIFDGWYTDSNLTQKYNFSTPVTKAFTLYAKWIESEKISLKFTDITKDAWYYDVVKTIAEKGLMNGISDTQFAPELEVTRGMFVTILYRAAGAPQVAKTSNFADVSADTYYAKAVAWASANGIVNGITENKFAPDYNITREQMAAILYRYAKNENKSGEITYTDKDAISDYALDATAWANAAGIMKGNEDGTFAPLRNASRAEAAAVFARLLKL